MALDFDGTPGPGDWQVPRLQNPTRDGRVRSSQLSISVRVCVWRTSSRPPPQPVGHVHVYGSCTVQLYARARARAVEAREASGAR